MISSVNSSGRPRKTVEKVVAAMIAFSLVFAAFSSEIWLGAFKTIPKGQFEAASALGLSPFTTFRKVVLPQLARIALPGLFKETTLVMIVGVLDIVGIAMSTAVAEKNRPHTRLH